MRKFFRKESRQFPLFFDNMNSLTEQTLIQMDEPLQADEQMLPKDTIRY